MSFDVLTFGLSQAMRISIPLEQGNVFRPERQEHGDF